MGKLSSNIIHNKIIKAIIVGGVNIWSSYPYIKYGTLIDLILLSFRDRKSGWKIKKVKDKRVKKLKYLKLKWK